jgi:hypothetical protein
MGASPMGLDIVKLVKNATLGPLRKLHDIPLVLKVMKNYLLCLPFQKMMCLWMIGLMI